MRGPRKTQALAELRERGIEFNTILDVGVANGTPELLDAFPNSHHVLFEPVTHFNRAIRSLYRAASYELHNVAISQSDGETSLKVRSTAANTAVTHSSTVDGRPNGEDVLVVPMARLDTIVKQQRFRPPFFLKIDVDGHELAVLSGALETLAASNVVMIEVQKAELSRRLAIIEAVGFELFDLVEPCYYDGSFWQCDAILIPRTVQKEKFRQLGTNFDRKLYSIFS